MESRSNIYMGYVSKEFYDEFYGTIQDENIQRFLDESSSDIDNLTFNRIRDFDKLTVFQQDTIKKVVCELMEFQYLNSDYLTSIFKSVKLDKLSYSTENNNYLVIEGVPILSITYKKLCKTGLCYRGSGLYVYNPFE